MSPTGRRPGGGASVLANVPATIALYRAYLADLRGDAEQAIAHASRALAEADEDEWMLASQARACLGLAEWMRGRPGEAEHLLSSAIPPWQAAGEYGLVIQACHHLGQVQLAQGRLDAALETYRQAVEIAATPGRQHPPTAGPGHVGAAEVAYQRGDLDDALRHVTDGIPLARNLAYTQPLASGLTTLAWIRQSSGDPAGALKAIGEAGQAAPGPPGLLNPVPAQRARLLLAQGNLPAAAGFVQQYGLGADDEPDYPREPGQLVLARVLLAQDRPGLALALLDRLHAAALAQDRIGSVIEIGALRTLALAASGDEAGAVTSLAGTLLLACPQGYVRVFADEGPPMAALLGRLVAAQRAGQAAAGVPLGYLAGLQRAFGAGPPAPGSGRDTAAVPGIVDPLTSRELEVLAMLAAGRRIRPSPASSWSAWTQSRSTSAMCWVSSVRPTAPRPSPGPVS
jgi:LuxR family transcriptional regulator, maltose regulon positive regulatory protein